MKTTLLSVGVAFLSHSSAYSDAPPKIEITQPQDGVYVTFGLGHSIVLELKEERFRYWFSSDRIPLEKVEYPLEGSFTVVGDSIALEHKKLIPLSSNWTFRTIDGVVTMWRSDAIKLLTEKRDGLDLYASGKENFFLTGRGSILVPTKKAAEEAWKSPQYATTAEAQHKPLSEKKEAQSGPRE